MRPIHLAILVRKDGAVSPLCAKRPRPLKLSQASWTLRHEAVTCAKCRRLLDEDCAYCRFTPATSVSA